MPQEIVTTKTRQEWATIINADWRKSIDSIIQTGWDLLAAKEDLPNGQFGKMVEEDLDFSWNTANKLMNIAEHPVIGDSYSSTNLPVSWRILTELSQLSKDDFLWAQRRGLITKKTSLRGANAIAGALKKEEGETWGANRQPDTLPAPTEARTIARETGRFVAASDGRVYSGATEDEGAEATRVTQQTYGAVDAINLIAALPEPQQWLEEAPKFQLRDLTSDTVERAATWLLNLSAAMDEQDGE